MAALTRPHGHKRSEGRKRLSLDDPRTKSCLAALDLSGVDVASVAAFSNKLHREVDAFHRQRLGRDEGNRLSRIDAARAYNQAFGIPQPKPTDHKRKALDLLRCGLGWPELEQLDLWSISVAPTLTADQKDRLAYLDAIAARWKAQRQKRKGGAE